MRLFFVRRERRYKYEVNSQTIKMREIQVLFYIRKSKDKWNLPVKIVSCLLQNLSFNISCSRTKLFLSVWIFVVTCCSKHFSNNPPPAAKDLVFPGKVCLFFLANEIFRICDVRQVLCILKVVRHFELKNVCILSKISCLELF